MLEALEMPEVGGAVISPSHDYYLLEEREHKWSLKLCQTFQTFMDRLTVEEGSCGSNQ